jgi:hypothetical protein
LKIPIPSGNHGIGSAAFFYRFSETVHRVLFTFFKKEVARGGEETWVLSISFIF